MATREKGIPVSHAAPAARKTREQLVRAIQKGEVAGACIGGRWFVERGELRRLEREAAARPDEAA